MATFRALALRFFKNEDGFLQFLAPVLGGVIGALGARSAARTQATAARDAAQVQQNMFDTTNEYFAPYREAGESALGTYVDQVGTDFTKTPGYQFGLDQGLSAIEGSAAARGNLMSGSTLQRLQEHGQDYATNQYDNWLNRVGGLMTTGQASAGQQAALGQNNANQQGNYLTQGANASAAGTVGAVNNLNQGVNNALGIWQYQQGQNQYQPYSQPQNNISAWTP